MIKFQPIHKHCMFKLISKKPIESEEVAKQFLLELVDKIQMVPATVPQAKYVTDFGNEGITASINVCTSHIALHCWDETGLLMLDVYSCCYFETNIVIDVTNKYWDLDKEMIRVLDIDRNDDKMYVWRL